MCVLLLSTNVLLGTVSNARPRNICYRRLASPRLSDTARLVCILYLVHLVHGNEFYDKDISRFAPDA